MLLRLGISVLLGHAKIDDMDNIGRLSIRPSNEKVVWLDITVDEVLLVNCLNSRELKALLVLEEKIKVGGKLTICLATITTVLIENLRLQ